MVETGKSEGADHPYAREDLLGIDVSQDGGLRDGHLYTVLFGIPSLVLFNH